MANLAKRSAVKVLWAVDPFHEQPREQLRSFEVLTKLFGKLPFSAQPVALIALGRFNPEAQEFQEKWHDMASWAMKKLETLVATVKHASLTPPHLIKQEGSTTSEAASGFLSYAIEEGAHLLVVSSHARKGVSRLLLGSFAESLVLQSPLPVLVVNPLSKAKSAARIKHVLFATDFSELSFQAFKRTVTLAAETGLTVLLFHKIQFLHPEIAPAFFYPAVSAESLKELRDGLKDEGQRWIAYAAKHGVKVKLHLDPKNGRALDEILRVAKKLGPTTMIAMASQSGKAGTLIMGSLTRQVLRQAPCPILVIHPEEESVVKQFVSSLKLAGYHYTARPAFF